MGSTQEESQIRVSLAERELDSEVNREIVNDTVEVGGALDDAVVTQIHLRQCGGFNDARIEGFGACGFV